MDSLTLPEARVLGCLVEKELTTPDLYPLSLNSLTTACNQSTSRDPVLSLEEATVQEAADGLRRKQWAVAIFGAGARVPKYRHLFPDHYELTRPELALVACLILRGPQTGGELRQRAERMAGGFSSLEAVEALLAGLAAGDDPLVALLPPAPGRKERRFAHRLCGEPADTAEPAAFTPAPPPPPGWQEEAAALRQELAELREAFERFRKQFE